MRWYRLTLALLLAASPVAAQEGVYEDPLPLGQLLHSEEAHIKDEPAVITGETTFEAKIIVEGSHNLGTFEEFDLDDATPDISGSKLWEFQLDHDAAVHITNFDGGVEGDEILVWTMAVGGITYEVGIFLVPGDVDLVAAPASTTRWINNGFGWLLLEYRDHGVDNSTGALVTFEFLDANGDIGFGASQVPEGDKVCALAGCAMLGDITFLNDFGTVYGTGNLAKISHDGANFLIDNGTGDVVITGGIMVSDGDNQFSMFGADPTTLNPSDTADMLVSRKLRSSTTGLNRRAGLFVTEVEADLATDGKANYGANAFVYTGEANTDGNTRASPGGAVGMRASFRHQSSGSWFIGGGVSSQAEVFGSDEDGVISNGYAFLDEGGDGGEDAPEGGQIGNYYGLWIKDSVGNVGVKTGIWIERLRNADTNIGIRVDDIEDAVGAAAIWVGASGAALTRSSGIRFGGDDDGIWRSAAGATGTLSTDSHFLIEGGTPNLYFRDTAIGIYSRSDTFMDLYADGLVRIGNSSGGSSPTTYLAIEPDADTFWVGDGTGIPFGHMYTNSTITVTIGGAGTPVEVGNTWTTGEVNEVTFGADHFLTVLKAGRYKIDWSMSWTTAMAGATVEVEGGIMIGGSAQVEGAVHRTLRNTTDIGAGGSTAILDLAANDQVSLYITNETNTTNIAVEHANVTVTMVGGT